MRRREFLVQSSRAALGSSILPRVARAQGNQTSSGLKDGDARETMIADLDRQIPQLMEKTVVPGLSMVIIIDAKLAWRGAFGVKDSASKELVDNDTVFEAASVSKTVFAYAVMKLCE